MTDQLSTLNSTIRDGFDATQKVLDTELPAVGAQLTELITASIHGLRYKTQVTTTTHMAEERELDSATCAEKESINHRSIHLHESRDLVHISREPSSTALRTLKPIHWNWSSYSLPVGILAIETCQAEVHCSNSRARPGKANKYTVKFRFAPLSWIMDGIIQVSYSVSVSAYHLPSWQSMMSDDTSLIPAEIDNALQEGALLDFLDCMEVMPYQSIHRMLHTNWGRRSPERTTGNSPLLDLRVGRAHNNALGSMPGYGVEVWFKTKYTDVYDRLVFPFQKKDIAKRTISSRRLRFWKPTIPLAALDPQCSHPELQQSRPCYQIIFKEAGIDHLLDTLHYPPPTICLPSTNVGVELFRQFVCPYIDPVHLTQLRDRDRWWLSALMYAERL